jgi:glutamate-1-semialdehyde 2,1-aminomutase
MNEQFEDAGIPVRMEGILSIWTVLYTKPSRYNWIYQFYLRREKLLLSWIGTGRLIFSHNYTETDFDQVMEAFIRAGEAMLADGWWHDSQLTNADISKLMFRQMLSTKFGLNKSEPVGHEPNLIGTKTDAR